jgi:WD40 repeat protein
VRLKGHAGKVRALAFRADGKQLASGGDDQVVRLWDLEAGKAVWEAAGHNREITGLAFSPDKKRLVSTSGDVMVRSNKPGEVKLWDLLTGRDCLTLTGGGKCLFGGAAFSPDGLRLYAAMTRLPEKFGDSSPGAVLVWDASPPGSDVTPGPVAPPPAPVKRPALIDAESARTSLRNVAFSPRGDRLAASLDTGAVVLFDTTTGRIVSRLPGHPKQTSGWNPYGVELAFSPGGAQLVSVHPDRGGGPPEVAVWNAATGEELRRVKTFADNVLRAGAIRGDGMTLLIAEGRSPKLTAAPLGETPGQPQGFDLAGHADPVTEALFSPDGKYLATLGTGPPTKSGWREPRELKIWDAATGRVLHTITGFKFPLVGLHFSPDGRRLAAGNTVTDTQKHVTRLEALVAWDVETGREALYLDKLPGLAYPFALGPEGKLLAAAVEDTYAIHIVDTTMLKTVRRLPGGREPLRSLTFSPDGAQLAAVDALAWNANHYDALRLWDLTRDDYPDRPPTPRPQFPPRPMPRR